jgi:tRNA uridine 5-carboxymethylaminomethyl modification enzyme
VGLIDDARWEELTLRWERADREIERLKSTRLAPTEAVNRMLEAGGTEPLSEHTTLAALLRRGNVDYPLIESLSPPEDHLEEEEAFHVETELRYVGYIEKQERVVSRMRDMDNVLIPEGFEYDKIKGMLAESRQKLSRFRPRSLGQALRISGVTPADVQLLAVSIKARR